MVFKIIIPRQFPNIFVLSDEILENVIIYSFSHSVIISYKFTLRMFGDRT
jgi:hypothetical protein